MCVSSVSPAPEKTPPGAQGEGSEVKDLTVKSVWTQGSGPT